jgi:hypothetical protein
VREGLIAYWISRGNVDMVLTKCGSCQRGGTTVRLCQGWLISFKERSALLFQPVEVHGHSVRVTVEGRYDFRHSVRRRPWPDWTSAPMAWCSSVILIEDPVKDCILTRQHLDLANPGQAGPVWHLQLGGLPSGRERPEHEWLDVSRWPSYPLDFALTTELVVYSFFWEAWSRLKIRNPWRLWIHRSEQLVVSHYHKRLSEYWDRPTNQDSWLAMQCNQSGWDPRPS